MFEWLTGRARRPLSTLVALSGLALASLGGVAHAQYRDFNQAIAAGLASLRNGQYEDARAPLEAALQMAGDDRSRLRAHAALCDVYFHAGQTEKVINSLDFVLVHAQNDAEANLVRGAMVRYAKSRGKAEELIRLYEGRLKANPMDVPALYVLSDIYSNVQRNPQRASELVTRLGEVLKKSSGSNPNFANADLAGQYVKAGKLKEGAAMYEQLAQSKPDMSGVFYKDAAKAWMQAGDRTKALAAAKNADSSVPENRSELLEYFYHRELGDLYYNLNEPASAAEHFEVALAKTKIDGYAKDTKKRLDQVHAILAKRGGAKTTTTGSTASISGSATIDLNKASLATLQKVDGITENIAVQIIDRRKSKPFESVSELIELDGVDKSTLTKIRTRVTVGVGK